VKSITLRLAAILITAAASSQAITVPVTQDTTTTTKEKVTVAGGKASTLSVSTGRHALLRFNLAGLPNSYDSSTVRSARLRLYPSRVAKPGDLNIQYVNATWSESENADAPALDPAPIATIPAANLATKRHVTVDVTDAVIDWLGNPGGNFGLAIVEAGLPNTAKVTFAAKEGPGSGPCAELEIELTGSSDEGQLLTGEAGNFASVPFGARYRDNSVAAWGRVTANGTLDTNFNVVSVTKIGTGHYKISLGGSAQSGFSLITSVTPEVDEAGGVPPVGLANLRFAVANKFANGTNFDVFMYNGSGNSVDNDFEFIVTGR
jgi:hypothetical protein